MAHYSIHGEFNVATSLKREDQIPSQFRLLFTMVRVLMRDTFTPAIKFTDFHFFSVWKSVNGTETWHICVDDRSKHDLHSLDRFIEEIKAAFHLSTSQYDELLSKLKARRRDILSKKLNIDNLHLL